jgi:translation initiation factor 1 (eIF-1/SUI1)
MLKKHTQTKFQQTRRIVQTLDDKHKNTRAAASMKDTKKNKNQTLTLRIEESKYGRVVTVMQQQVLGSSSGRELEAALCHRFCLHTTPAGESTP